MFESVDASTMPWVHGVLMDLPELLPTGALDSWYAWDESLSQNEKVGEHSTRSLLQIAASMQAVKCVEKLLAAGADATAVSPSDGKTALHLACSCRPSMASAKIIALLVQYGADRDAMDHCGRVPGHSLEQMTASQQQGSISDTKPAALMTPISVLQEIDGCDYSSDDFRMYRYKVELCPHLDSCLHDTAACPYLHPGEKARRRHPREYTYRAVPCPHFRKGNCKLGDMCPLSHGVFEAWLHPSKYRTQLCTEGKACQRDLCFFAHSLDQLRDPSEEGCKCSSADSSPGACSGTTTPSGYVTRDSTENIKLASLQAAAFEKEQVRRANAVADAVEALKTLAASRKTGIWPQHAPKSAENERLPRFGSDCHSVLSIPESSSSDSLDIGKQDEQDQKISNDDAVPEAESGRCSQQQCESNKTTMQKLYHHQMYS